MRDDQQSSENRVIAKQPRVVGTGLDDKNEDEELVDNNVVGQINTRPRVRHTYFGDFTADDVKNPEKAYKMWLCAKKTIDKHRQTIKYLQNRTYKLKRIINSLQDLVQHLKRTKKISDNCFSVLQV